MNVCIVCGATFPLRDELEVHWRDELHHPAVTDLQARDRARAAFSAKPIPEPSRSQALVAIDEYRRRRE